MKRSDLSAFLNHFRARKQLEPKCIINSVIHELDKQGRCDGFQQMKTYISVCNWKNSAQINMDHITFMVIMLSLWSFHDIENSAQYVSQ